MAEMVVRGARRSTAPEIFLSHSSRDKEAALQLARVLNLCSIDVWLDDWELEIGQSLTDEIASAMEKSKFIAILITEHYNKSVWTKTEYKKALSREQKEGRVVMLPIIIGDAQIPAFIEDKLYVDMRSDFYSGIMKLVGLVHGITKHRVSEALTYWQPKNVSEVWRMLEEVGFTPYVVLGEDDFNEIVKGCGSIKGDNYGTFDPYRVLQSNVSKHS